MSKPRMTPLGSFDPRMIDLLIRAGSAPIRLASVDGTADLNTRIMRFRTLRQRMLEEKHPLAAQVAGVWIRWDAKTNTIVIESRDRGLDDLVEIFPDGRLERLADRGGTDMPLPGPDPLEAGNDLRHKRSFVYEPVQAAFDNPADKAPNEEPEE